MTNFQIVGSLADEASGPTYSVTRLAESLADRGNHTFMISLDDCKMSWARGRLEFRTFGRDFQKIPGVSKLEFSKALKVGLASEHKPGAVLHVHGLWRMVNVYPGRIARRLSAPLIVSPRGMLGAAALQFSSIQKQLFWFAAQKRALSRVRCFHATSHSELEEIRAYGLSAPVAIITNGIDVPAAPATSYRGEQRTVLYLGRIHPKKGVDWLIRSWSLVEEQSPGWRLRIVGPSELGHVDELRALTKQLGLTHVYFEGPLYGTEKQEAYASADLFVLPTQNENFGMVAAEALAQGTPVISTKGAPWQRLETEGCGWWVDLDVDKLAAALNDAMTLPQEELEKMGARGRDWMNCEFSWPEIAERMEWLYRWCGGKADKPDFVVT